MSNISVRRNTITKLAIRIDNLEPYCKIKLFNEFAYQMGYSRIEINNEMMFDALVKGFNEDCDEDNQITIWDGIHSEEYHKEDKFVTIVNRKFVSFDESRAIDFIPCGKLALAIINDALKKNEVEDDTELFHIIMDVRAYAFINTCEYNNDGKYYNTTKVIEGIPLADEEGWERELIADMSVGCVRYSSEYGTSAMVIRMK